MLNKAFGITLLSILLFSVNALAGPPSQSQVQKFIVLSGLGDAIDAMPDMFQQQINMEALVRQDKVALEVVSMATEEAVQKTNGYEIAENYLLTETQKESIGQTIAFLESPLGTEITRVEKEALDPNYDAEVQAYAVQLAQNAPEPARVRLIESLTQELNAEEVIINMLKTMMFASQGGLVDLSDEASQAFKDAIEKEWSKLEPIVRSQMREYVILSSYYSYRDLSDSQLGDYIAFLKTDHGKIYWEASIEIFQRYVSQIMRHMTQAIVASKS